MKFGKIFITVFLFCGGAFSQSNIDFTQIEHYSSRILENDHYRKQDLHYVTTENTMVYSNDWELVGTEEKNTLMENCYLTIASDHYLMIGKNNYWINADDLHISESSLFPQGNDYIAIRDTPIYKMKSDWNGIYYEAEEMLKEGDHAKLRGNAVSDIAKLYGDVIFGIFINIYSAEGEGIRVNANDIKSVKSKQVISSKYLSVPEDATDTIWVRKYLLKMIGNQNIRLALDYQPQLKGYGEANVYDDGWYAEVLREPMIITNVEIGLGLSGNIENTIIENTDNGFIIYSNGNSLDKEEFSDYEFETDELKRFEFKFDGDYCSIYLNDSGTPLLSFVKLKISEYHKLKKLIEVPTEVFFDKYQNQLEEYLLENTINPNEFIWPRHADGTCDYDANGNIAAASENSSKEKSESGEHAKSAEEAAFPEAAESESPNKDAESTDVLAKKSSDAKQNAALPILPIAAGGVALAVLLAVVLLAVRKRKSGKK